MMLGQPKLPKRRRCGTGFQTTGLTELGHGCGCRASPSTIGGGFGETKRKTTPGHEHIEELALSDSAEVEV
jgi:hypothetical protein